METIMWWRIDASFFRGDVSVAARESASSKNDSMCDKRLLFAIQLISESLECPVHRPKTQEKFFDLLVERGIFREVEGGFSAYDWLFEQGRVGAMKCKPKGSEPVEKKFVRENVSLTAKEIESLHKSHTARDVERFYDRLSKYKGETGKAYQSDYKAILAWVVGAVKEDDAKKQTDQDGLTCNFQAYKKLSSEEAFKIGHGGRTPEEQAEVDAFNKSEKAQEYRARLQKLIDSKR